MDDTVTKFYAKLTPFYHLIYPDWDKSIEHQASILGKIVRGRWGNTVNTVLDAACGIGTQSLGLAKLGYQVRASDLSQEGVERAKREATIRDLVISFSVADMRTAYVQHATQFDLVIACDNAVPHLLTDDDILMAFKQFYKCTRSGGGCIISVRDYEAEDMTGQKIKLYGSRNENNITYLIFQKWDCEGDFYNLSMYFIEDDGNTHFKTHVMRSRYYAISTTKLIKLMTDAGFTDVVRLNDKFFQPVIIGTRKE
ncbi:MAG: class I SAM-dependent methyltransferase [Planctomycetota bacterium]|jgi:SAM-dependent methyltransferase